jgi:glutathione peroxidase
MAKRTTNSPFRRVCYKGDSMSAFTTIPVKTIKGQDTSLAAYSGKVLLVVNVASKCGLTPQYEGLEKLYQKYKSQGFEVLGFPANNFMGQEPGTNEEIVEFCKSSYDVSFPLFQKISVKGDNQHPLYKALTHSSAMAQDSKDTSFVKKIAFRLLGGMNKKATDISWNFEKFLIDRKGNVVARFAPTVKPEDPLLVSALEKTLKAN